MSFVSMKDMTTLGQVRIICSQVEEPRVSAFLLVQ